MNWFTPARIPHCNISTTVNSIPRRIAPTSHDTSKALLPLQLDPSAQTVKSSDNPIYRDGNRLDEARSKTQPDYTMYRNCERSNMNIPTRFSHSVSRQHSKFVRDSLQPLPHPVPCAVLGPTTKDTLCTMQCTTKSISSHNVIGPLADFY
jgi:hypothetical protein